MKKSICVFVNNYTPKTETFILNHLYYLRDSGRYTITVLCHHWDGEFNIGDEVEVIAVPQTFTNRFFGFFKLLWKSPITFFKLLKPKYASLHGTSFPLAEKLAGRHFDIIHTHFGHNGRLISPLIIEQIITKNIFINHFYGLDISSEKCTAPGFYNLLHQSLDIPLTNTKFSASLVSKLGFDLQDIKKVVVGSDVNFFAPTTHKSPNSLFKLIFIGRLIELKGVTLLPEIENRLKEKIGNDFVIDVIGGGTLLDFLLNHTSQNLDSNIVVHGYKNRTEIKELLEEASVFIYPGYKDDEGREETQGTVVQEAMLMKVPVVVTNVGGVAEAVEDNVTGFIVDQKDIDAFVERLVWLYHNREKAIEMGEKAYSFAKENYSVYRSFELIEKLYE